MFVVVTALIATLALKILHRYSKNDAQYHGSAISDNYCTALHCTVGRAVRVKPASSSSLQGSVAALYI